MRGRVEIALSLAVLAACVLTVGFSAAKFTDTEQNPQTVSAVADFVAPIAGASVIAKTQGGAAGYIAAKGTYYVYASVTESGNPASGIASVIADVSVITSKQTSVPLIAGSYTAGGVSYNYRSAQLTADSTLTAGSKSYTLALADSAGNSRSQSFSVTVDNGPFAGSSFATGDVAGGTEGKPEKGDTVTFTFTKAPEPGSIVSGWDGSGTKSVTVSITDNASNDGLSVSGATIGTVALNGDFTDKGVTFSESSMSLSGSTVTIVLGTVSGSAKTNTKKVKPVWTPSASVFDQAWNACSTANVNGAEAKQF
ncbi:MAG TPA: hypothetical protein VHR65_03235 [Solirubrobacterales bacterium]|nr:hypothetical protein [Solirubrobacterales bacterium]